MNAGLRAFIGRWRIRQMDVWDQDYVDLVVPGYIEVEPDGQGSFQFGTVSGGLDGRLRQIGDVTFFEWSWWGQSDTDDGCGRGWAQIENEKLVGRIFIYGSDDSSFIAERNRRSKHVKRQSAKSRSSRV